MVRLGGHFQKEKVELLKEHLNPSTRADGRKRFLSFFVIWVYSKNKKKFAIYAKYGNFKYPEQKLNKNT